MPNSSYAKGLKELSLVDGVARVDLWGAQRKVIYLDVAETQLTELGLSLENIAATLQLQNAVVDAGGVDLLSRRLRIAPSRAFASPEDIGDLDPVEPARARAGSGRQRPLRVRQRADPNTRHRHGSTGLCRSPSQLMRFGGEPAIGSPCRTSPASTSSMSAKLWRASPSFQVSCRSARSTRSTGSPTWSAKRSTVPPRLPRGARHHHRRVTLFMGWRMGVVIGFALIFTLCATFIVMALAGIDLQRVSLGALVIALGMMVDNAIVTADGYLLRCQRG